MKIVPLHRGEGVNLPIIADNIAVAVQDNNIVALPMVGGFNLRVNYKGTYYVPGRDEDGYYYIAVDEETA